MGHIVWGLEPELFGPRHAHREGRILRALQRLPAGPAGLHLECAAGVGSLSQSLAGRGRVVVAADLSLRSLLVLRDRSAARPGGGSVLPVVADITRLPFADESFATASSAETLEHIPDDRAAVAELARVLEPGGTMVGTVPADQGSWQDWDEWAGHLRRYSASGLGELLGTAGLIPRVVSWGWPLVRLYDSVFLNRINRRRLSSATTAADDHTLRTVSKLGRQRWLVRLVRLLFELDRICDGVRWGVGLLFIARRKE